MFLRQKPKEAVVQFKEIEGRIDVMNWVWVELPDLRGQSAKLVRPGGMSSLEGRLGFDEQISNTCSQNKHQNISTVVYLFYISLYVNVDSVRSAAHSELSALQYPFLVQPESSGTPQPCTAAEPWPPLSGNTHICNPTHLVFVYMWGAQRPHVLQTKEWPIQKLQSYSDITCLNPTLKTGSSVSWTIWQDLSF